VHLATAVAIAARPALAASSAVGYFFGSPYTSRGTLEALTLENNRHLHTFPEGTTRSKRLRSGPGARLSLAAGLDGSPLNTDTFV
jgi:hypothetical protein